MSVEKVKEYFKQYGIKKTRDGEECVLTKSLELYSPEKTIKENYPIVVQSIKTKLSK